MAEEWRSKGKAELLSSFKGYDIASAKVIARNTFRVFLNDGDNADDDGIQTEVIRYHNTNVVVRKGALVQVNSGGFLTNTTKRRIMEHAGIGIYQKNFVWYLDNGTPFEDGMVFDSSGALLGVEELWV